MTDWVEATLTSGIFSVKSGRRGLLERKELVPELNWP